MTSLSQGGQYRPMGDICILLPAHPLNRRQVDPAFQAEKNAIHNLGMTHCVVPEDEPLAPMEGIDQFIYRGWMKTEDEYAKMFGNIPIINSPTQYANCHYNVSSYSKIQKMPETFFFWSITPDIAKIYEEMKPHLQSSDFLVKDFVKSEHRHWHEACFIPQNADFDKFNAVVARFLQLRGPRLNKGLAFKKYVKLTTLEPEYRFWFLNNSFIHYNNHSVEPQGLYPPQYSEIKDVILSYGIESNFYSVDIAYKDDGDWVVIETGDGQVSGISKQDECELLSFYRAMQTALRNDYE